MSWFDTLKGVLPEDQYAVVAGHWLNRRHLGPYDRAEAEWVAAGVRGKVVRLTQPIEDDDQDQEQPGAFGRALNSGAFGHGSGHGLEP